MSPIRHILVATDFSDCSRAAVDFARDLAQSLHASLGILHVWEITPLLALSVEYATGELMNALEDAASKQLDEELARVRTTFPGAEAELRFGISWEEIARVAKDKGADLLVLGTHGRTGWRQFLMGSVASRVVRIAPVPVITVRQPKAAS